LDGNRDRFKVRNLIDLGLLNCRVEDSYVVNGSGNCIHNRAGFDPNSSPSWIHWIRGNTVGNCGGWGIIDEGTDAIIEGNYVSGNSEGNILIHSQGGIRVVGNQIELSPGYGLKIANPDRTAYPSGGATIVGNEFNQNSTGVWFAKSSSAADIEFSVVFVANRFTASKVNDILVDGHLHGGTIANANFVNSSPSGGHIRFNGTDDTNWRLDFVARPGIIPIVNPPPDATVVSNGFFQTPGVVRIGSFYEGLQTEPPDRPRAGAFRLFSQIGENGKMKLMVLFPTGAPQQIAAEP
jgi:hypothetical protein